MLNIHSYIIHNIIQLLLSKQKKATADAEYYSNHLIVVIKTKNQPLMQSILEFIQLLLSKHNKQPLMQSLLQIIQFLL